MNKDQVRVWTVVTGEFRPFAIGKQRRIQERVISLIRKTEGLIGVHPVPGRGTLFLYASENEAKRAKNILDGEGVQTGRNIGEALIPIADYENATSMKKWGRRG